jgi:hypothetical protein
MKINLYCHTCKNHKELNILPWQTEKHIMGGISIICSTCSTLKVISLKDIPELKIKEIYDTKNW